MNSSGFGELPAPLTLKLPVASMAPVREVSDAGICGRGWWGRRISNIAATTIVIGHTLLRREGAAGMTRLS